MSHNTWPTNPHEAIHPALWSPVLYGDGVVFLRYFFISWD